MTEIVIVLVVVVIVMGFAVIQIAEARDQMTLTNAARSFAAYTEKTRIDSVRRHGADGGGDGAVTLNSSTQYVAFLDHDYNGTPSNNTLTFPDGVVVTNIAVTNAAGTTTTVTPSAGTPVTVTFNWRGRTSGGESYRINFTNERGHPAVVGITAAGEVSLDREPITLAAGDYDPTTGDSGSLGPGGTGGTSTGGGSTTTGGGSTTDGGGSTTDGGGSTTDGGGSTTDGGGSTTDGGGSTDDGGGSTDDGGSTTDGGGTTTDGGSTTTGSGQCSMSLSPTSSTSNRISFQNSGSNRSTFVTATLSNAPTGATISASEHPTANVHLTVEVTGMSIKITAGSGQSNRGNYTVRVTPPTGCGGTQDIFLSVTN
jgi:Tfp pilus assembly protein FimT